MRVLPLAAAVRFVIYSSPDTNQVYYWRAPSGPWGTQDDGSSTPTTGAAPSGVAAGQAELLFEGGAESLEPRGIAVDHNRNGLYVACPGTAEIRRYVLVETGSAATLKLEVGSPVVVVSNVKARWVAVDAVGNLFFSREEENSIVKVPAAQLIDPGSSTLAFMKEGVHQSAGTYKSEAVVLEDDTALYAGTKVPAVSSPGGVAVDNFRVFWTNKVFGTQAGSVVQGFEVPPQADKAKVTPIAANANKVLGICLSANNVYFTDEHVNLYGVKKYGGAIATISTRMVAPRGCAWDGDGTVYVADYANGETGAKIYSFPANMKSLAPQKLEVAYDTTQVSTQPFGIAVYSTADANGAVLLSLLAPLALLL